MEASVRRDRNGPLVKNDLAYTYVIAGRVDKGRKILSELLEPETQNHSSGGAIAAIYSALGKIDSAFEWLETAYEGSSLA